MSERLLTLSDVHNEYSKGTEILKGVDLTVDKGDVIAIVGPSGSGKTTMLRCISFLEIPSKGHMEFAGKSIDMNKVSKKDIKDIRMNMSYVFQSYNLFRNMTVMQNVLEGLVTARKIAKPEAEARAREVLSKVGMLEYINKYPDELSGGQQQRVAIARAIAPNPQIVLLDEPTSALDPELISEVLDVMRQLAKSGATMILVTHQMEFAREIATKIVLMEDGVKVEEGTAEEMFTAAKKERTRQFFSKW